MTQDDIIRMDCSYTTEELRGAFFEGYFKGAAAEREECAKVCDLVAREIDDTNGTATYIAKALRARGQQ